MQEHTLEANSEGSTYYGNYKRRWAWTLKLHVEVVALVQLVIFILKNDLLNKLSKMNDDEESMLDQAFECCK